MEREVEPSGNVAQRARAAPPARAAADPRARVLELQRTIGNRATGQMLQRWDIDDVWDVVKGPALRIPGNPFTGGLFDVAIDQAFDIAVAYGRSHSTVAPIPAAFDTKLDEYAAANPKDGKILKAARARRPTFHNGGLVPSDALAMTLDRDVFCGAGEPTVDTYIHELVHVWQYGEVGPARFLQNLLGSGAVGVLVQLVRGKTVDIMKASAYEKEAYNVECRFKKWAGYSLPDGYCDAQGRALD